ncbi:hypothetical protein D8674_040901 [Pyrus ussuriensis x Pyrus communis]|uniref:Uncharacterized protein n=1 Tax=Pyrus ussuriensis x Pyrus communis TaxID=2448454 RepID=A0A5N5GA10_9ROSA|nr:hypothetical protein D8674_040901 [Pyrus ussuriensis x Pyrus communis]
MKKARKTKEAARSSKKSNAIEKHIPVHPPASAQKRKARINHPLMVLYDIQATDDTNVGATVLVTDDTNVGANISATDDIDVGVNAECTYVSMLYQNPHSLYLTAMVVRSKTSIPFPTSITYS